MHQGAFSTGPHQHSYLINRTRPPTASTSSLQHAVLLCNGDRFFNHVHLIRRSVYVPGLAGKSSHRQHCWSRMRRVHKIEVRVKSKIYTVFGGFHSSAGFRIGHVLQALKMPPASLENFSCKES